MARLVAGEVRRYRERQQPRMSAQQLSDRTGELSMLIPRSVLANLESGRRETVSVAEVVVLAAALNVSPIELMCPAGSGQHAEILPGRLLDWPETMRWITGKLKMDVTEVSMTLRQPGPTEQSSTRLMEYHDELIARLRKHEAEAVSAAAAAAAAQRNADTEAAMLWEEAAKAGTTSSAAAAGQRYSPAGIGAEEVGIGAEEVAAAVSAAHAVREARYRMMALAEWRDAIREPLRWTREEMRSRGMLLPDLPSGFGLGENDAGWLSPDR